MRKIITPFTMGLFGLFLALIAAEIALRVILAQKPAPTHWNDRPPFYYAPEKAPTLQGQVYEIKKPANTFRLAVIGDSFSFAPNMQYLDSFPEILKRMLNLNDTPLKAEVINYAVPALSAHHEVPLVEQALREDADLMILQITLNDPEFKPLTPTGIQKNFNDSFAPMKPSGFYGFAKKYWKTAAFIMERLHNKKTHDAYRKYFFDLFEGKKTGRLFDKSIRKIAKLSANYKKPLVAVIFPLFGFPLDAQYPFHELHKKVSDLLNSLKIQHLDLYELYADIPIERLQTIPGEDRHPNEIAHRMAAERIYSWLSTSGLIPEELKIRKRYLQRLGTVNQPTYAGD